MVMSKKLREELEIHRLLVVGLKHLTHRGRKVLEQLTSDDTRDAGRGVYMDEYAYGYHLVLAEDNPDEEWIDPSVRAIVVFAREHGCTHVRIDADGPTVKSLPTY